VGSEVLTSNNVVVALTINDDHEGVGLRTGSSIKSEPLPTPSHLDRVASITIETEGGDTENEKMTNVEISIRPDLLDSLNISPDSSP